MRFGSVCSGIEAASCAWHPLGWTTVFVSEIDAFPSAVLAHHYPDVPNLGDVTKFKEWPDATIDVLVGGTPCQSFSVAGLRAGLADPRGNLMLTYLAIADRYRPEWLVWENVPGVLSSNKGRDFGAFLGGLGELGYGFAYRILDAQFFGVAQRRRRVFVVANSRSWQRAAAVLFERSSLRGDSAPGREKGKDIAGTIVARAARNGGASNQDVDGGSLVTHPLRADGFDASEYGTGRGTPLIAFDTTQITSAANYSNPQAGDPCHPLAAGAHVPAIAFTSKDHGGDAMTDCAPTLRAGGHAGSHANAGVMPAIAFNARQDPDSWNERTGPLDTDGSAQAIAFDQHYSPSDITGSLTAGGSGGKNDMNHPIAFAAMQVRRLTPRECERLQGFPDDYTLITVRGQACGRRATI